MWNRKKGLDQESVQEIQCSSDHRWLLQSVSLNLDCYILPSLLHSEGESWVYPFTAVCGRVSITHKAALPGTLGKLIQLAPSHRRLHWPYWQRLDLFKAFEPSDSLSCFYTFTLHPEPFSILVGLSRWPCCFFSEDKEVQLSPQPWVATFSSLLHPHLPPCLVLLCLRTWLFFSLLSHLGHRPKFLTSRLLWTWPSHLGSCQILIKGTFFDDISLSIHLLSFSKSSKLSREWAASRISLSFHI